MIDAIASLIGYVVLIQIGIAVVMAIFDEVNK